MVLFKITDGEVTRRFKVKAGELSYDQLRERIASLFPKALGDNSTNPLLLKYRDSDGDIITISSDLEFQEVLSELPADHIWKLHITAPRSKRNGRSYKLNSRLHRKPVCRQVPVPSDFFFHDLHTPFAGLRSGLCSRPLSLGSWGWRSPWSGWDRELERMLAQHSQELNALHNSSERSQDTNAESIGEEANSGKTAESSVSNSSADIAVSKIPGLKVKSFGSWEPEEFDYPFGRGKIIGPVGYYVSWNSNSDSEEEEDTPTNEKEEVKETGEAEKMETTTQ